MEATREQAQQRYNDLLLAPMPDNPDARRQHYRELAEASRQKNNLRPGLLLTAYMCQPNHDHERIRSQVRGTSYVRHMVVASVAMGCIECADIIINNCNVPLSILLFASESVSGKRQQDILDYYVKLKNEHTYLPLLLAFGHNSTQNTILDHSLYTRDVLRAILMLATLKLSL